MSTLLNKHHIHNDEYVSTFNKANFLFLIKKMVVKAARGSLQGKPYVFLSRNQAGETQENPVDEFN